MFRPVRALYGLVEGYVPHVRSLSEKRVLWRRSRIRLRLWASATPLVVDRALRSSSPCSASCSPHPHHLEEEGGRSRGPSYMGVGPG